MKTKWCGFILIFIVFNLGAKELTFHEALDIIIKNDTYIPPSKAYLESEKTSRFSSALQFLPSVETGYKKNYDLITDGRSNSLYVSGNLNIFKGGADLSAFESKLYSVNKMEKGLVRLEIEREQNAIALLIQMISSKRKLKIQNEMVSIKQRSLKLAKERYDKGFAPHDDVLKAQVDYQNANAGYYGAQIDYQDVRAKLMSLLGDLEVSDNWPFSNQLLKIRDFEQDQDNEESSHPKILELQNQFYEQQKRQNHYRGLLLPSVDFNLSWQKNEILKTISYDRVGVLTVSWQLFDGLFRWSNYKAQSAERINTEFALMREKRQIKEELQSSREKLKLSIETAKNRDETLKVSRKLFEKNIHRYNQGKISITDLEWEQNRLLTSENLACDGWAYAHLSFQDYCHNTGKLLCDCL